MRFSRNSSVEVSGQDTLLSIPNLMILLPARSTPRQSSVRTGRRGEGRTVDTVALGPDGAESRTKEAVSRTESTRAQDPRLRFGENGVVEERVRFAFSHEHTKTHKVSIATLARRSIASVRVVRLGRRGE